jgi:hypothetical protein
VLSVISAELGNGEIDHLCEIGDWKKQACDGIFDVMTNQEVIDLALEYIHDPKEGAAVIVRAAYVPFPLHL